MDNLGNPVEHQTLDILYDQNFITLYRGLNHELCQAIIDLFDSDKNKSRGKIGGSQDAFYEDDTKVSWDLQINNEGNWRDIFQRIHPPIQSCIAAYLARSPILRSFDLQATGYKIQMYPKNEGYFRWHADSVGRTARDRVVAMVLYLNNVQKGGETEFFHQGLKVAPQAGHLLLFPAEWNYMHCGHTPESNDKYIISTFIQIKN